MFPLRRNAIPPNIFFSFSPLRFPRERRIRPASVSSNAIEFDWVWVRWELAAPPNGSRLSCGRLARRRKGGGRRPGPGTEEFRAGIEAINGRQVQALVR